MTNEPDEATSEEREAMAELERLADAEALASWEDPAWRRQMLLEILADYECPECGAVVDPDDPLALTEDEALLVLGGDQNGFLRCPNDWCDEELEPTLAASIDMLKMVAERMPELADFTNRDGPPPPATMCQICSHVLTLHVDVLGPFQIPEWCHPGGLTFDHDPVPVPQVDDQVAPICDCCSALEVTATAIATPFTVTHHGTEHRDNGTWALCSDCQALLENDRGDLLVDRATRILTARHGQQASASIATILNAFLVHWTGEIDRHTPSAQ